MGKQPEHKSVCFWRDPALPGLEVRFSSYRRNAFRRHMHSAQSIGIILEGETVFDLEGTPHRAGAGDMVFIPAEMVHACNPQSTTALTYIMFYVDLSLLGDVAREVWGDDVELPNLEPPVVTDDELFAQWRNLHAAIAHGAELLERQSLMIQALGSSIKRFGRTDGESAPERPKASLEVVASTKSFLQENMCGKVNLEELARVAGLSRYHFLRVFQEQTGLPPHTYQNQLRVNRAKEMLAESMPIAQVAAELGFTDQSHFSRVFKQFTAATPRQYQESPST